jgi:hypothetical protein
MRKKLLSTTAFVTLAGCATPDISDPFVNDRVKACGAGFSDQLRASLEGSLNKVPPSGELTGDIKQETKIAILGEVTDAERVKVYEDYIGCVEKTMEGTKATV